MQQDSGYLLELFCEGTDFSLYRGRKTADQTQILAVSVSDEHSPYMHRLEHEYRLAGELDPSWAAQPIELMRFKEKPALILRDPGGTPLDLMIKQNAGRTFDPGRFLRAAIGLTAAVDRAHRQGLIHKDIKPTHIFVNEKGDAWLTGFGIACKLLKERQVPASPDHFVGSLAYMAPEQTGRMNRSVDSRSDLYSLGITFYEMSTGHLPFTASDPMEWVHCQIARQPTAPHINAPDVPSVISAIIMKLLAKSADDRYQTAAGLKRDLERCLNEWQIYGRIDEFGLGQDDKSDHLLIPEKLYGRAVEIRTLLRSFNRVVDGGRAELVLVSGYSGIGKSSVVGELHKALVPPRGLFASGKFDQYKRDIPYATVAQALQHLIHLLLAKNEADLSHWRQTLSDALGANGQLMVELIPELKHIIGEQPPVLQISPQDAKARFHQVFRQFISAFTRRHPVALFLDDLQWLDAATLDLMEDLLTHPDVHGLLLIGAYRDNEVDSAHPLIRKIDSLRRAEVPVVDIVLTPLTQNDLVELIADTLLRERERVFELAKLTEEKTNGNPFFSIQFLSNLEEESLLHFDYDKGQWSWNLNGIRAKGYTDNVIDLMTGRLNRLPTTTQNALQQLACLGNSASFSLLAAVYGEVFPKIEESLWEAIRAGVIVKSKSGYRFVHDRFQEAAYALIPPDERAERHLKIGLKMADPAIRLNLEDEIFEIVNQLNRGSHLLSSAEEREYVAELNAIAGRQAKASTAYPSALTYLRAGRKLLGDETWVRRYELMFSIEYLIAECELLTADMPAAESRLSMLAEYAKTTHDIARVAQARLALYNHLDRSEKGINVFIEYQKYRGETWPVQPTNDEVLKEYERVWTLLGDKPINALADLPLVQEQALLDVLDVLTEFLMTAVFADENLLTVALCRIVCLSLEHGNSDASCFAYLSFGMLVGTRFGDYERGFEFGKLGYELVEKHELQRYQARVYLRFANHIMPWRQHVKEGRQLTQRAFDKASWVGDLTMAAYCCNNINTNMLAAGDPLSEVQREAEAGLAFAKKVRFDRVIDQIRPQLALVRTLRGLTPVFGSFDDDTFDEAAFESHFSDDPALGAPQCWYWIRKLQARYLSRDFASASQASAAAQRLIWTSTSYFEAAEYHYYSALTKAATFDNAPFDRREAIMEAIAGHHRQLSHWAQNCAENFENRATLVEAEIARISGRDLDAMRLYEKTILSAQTHGFIHNAAIANELSGQFCLDRKIDTAGYAYLRTACALYEEWGASAKVRQLLQRYPRLGGARAISTSSDVRFPVERLDVETVIKASQILSSEIILSKLIERLMRIALEHAGAERGLLILLRDNEWSVEAEAVTGVGTINVSTQQLAIEAADLPLSIFNHAARTQATVLLDDAYSEGLYSNDFYVQRKRSKSVLCLPVVKQAILTGILYLENNLITGAFTPARVALLELVASQASISLENAILYENLQRSEAFMAHGQRISSTGSFGWAVENGDLYWSDEIYRILEYEKGQRASVDLALRRVHPEDRDSVDHLLSDAVNRKTDFATEHRLLMPDGRVKHVHVSGRAVATGNLSFVGAVQDITERKTAEEELQNARLELAHVVRVASLNAMTASIAHEVRQPLSGILINAKTGERMLSSDPPNVSGAADAFRRTIRDANRASDVINRLREMFSARVTPLEEVDINDLAREVIDLSAAELKKNHVVLGTALEAGLPMIKADRVQLQQVVLNLLLNASDAVAAIEDRPKSILVTTGFHDGGRIMLAVQDNGPGLSKGSVEKLFEAFYTTKPQGMGVGLFISRSIIERHGGRLRAEDNGTGATFSFTIPIAPPQV